VFQGNCLHAGPIHLLESHATCRKKRLNPIVHITFIVADHGTCGLPTEGRTHRVLFQKLVKIVHAVDFAI
jgi:hypothetical protein